MEFKYTKQFTIKDFLILFILSTLIRFLLESYSNSYELNIGFFLHLLTYFVVVFSSVSILLFFFMNSNIVNCLRTSFSLTPIVLLPPILDLMFSLGKGMTSTYYSTLQFSMSHFLLFLPKNEFGEGPSLGLRITIFFLLIILSYIVYKNNNHKSISKSILTFLCGFFGFYLFSSLVAIIFLFSSSNFTDFDFAKVYLVLLSIFLPLFYYFYDKKGFSQIKNDLLISRIIYQIIIFLFGFFYVFNANLGLHILDIYLFSYSLFLMCVFSIVTNNLEDVDIDKISNSNRSTTKKNFSIQKYREVGQFSFIFGFLISLFSNIYLCLFLLIWTGVYYIYSCRPFRFKKIPLFSKFLLSFNSLILFIGGYYLSNQTQFIPVDIVILYIVFFTLSYNIIDIKDYKSDKKYGIKTIVGLFPSSFIAKIFICFILAFLYWYYTFLLDYNLWYVFLSLYIILIYTILGIKFKDTVVMSVFVFSKLVFIILIVSYSNQLLFFESEKISEENLKSSIESYLLKIESYQSADGTFKSMVCKKNGNCQFVNVKELDFLKYLEIKNIKFENDKLFSIERNLNNSLEIQNSNNLSNQILKNLNITFEVSNNENICETLLDNGYLEENLDIVYFNLKLNDEKTCFEDKSSKIYENLNLINPKHLDFKKKVVYFNILIELNELENIENDFHYFKEFMNEVIGKKNSQDYFFIIELYEKNDSLYYSREYLFILVIKLITFYYDINYN
ncbi:MAG: UbiA family prenyltransferase [Candidatus Nanoarchaeia archaeon]